MQVLEIVVYIIIIAAVLWLSYYVSKKMSNNVGGFNSSKYIKHLDRLALSKESFLSVVQIGDKYMVLGVSADRIDMLKELEEDNLKPIEKPVLVPKNPISSARTYIEKALLGFGANKKNKSISKTEGQAYTENINLQGIEDVTEVNQLGDDKGALVELLSDNKNRQLFSQNTGKKNTEYNDEIFDEILKRTAVRANKLKQKNDADEDSRYV